ncbi:transposase [Magnetospirillum fulvum]|uniref:Transposase, IS4 n=1 Tax=Magnetospirillum fulvum MGU-K5 TaxID=1316936 RepID=S9S8A9_MAGFU|nr:transposase [Magnetospirillum fulvum]EPY00909.1 Transposase, IS4 [Magnetospirillum fulvum MGU-K5]
MINDRLTFKRFLGLGLADKAPDAKTIWLFRETLTEANAIEKLFAVFDTKLKEGGYLAMSGQIIDATITTTTRSQAIREGRIPDGWEETPHKLAQKDRDARWTLKRARAKTPKAEGAKAKGVEIASVTRTTSRPTGATASSGAGEGSSAAEHDHTRPETEIGRMNSMSNPR